MSPTQFEGFAIQTSPTFASVMPDHRMQIRCAIKEFILSHSTSREKHFSAEFAEGISNLLNLELRPRVPGWGISISHCAELGGFITGPSSRHIGLDLEVSSRVTPQLANRIAIHPGEKTILGRLENSEALFWVAKEAAIKAFGNRDPFDSIHLGEVEITALDFNGPSFSARRKAMTATGTFLQSASMPTSTLSTNVKGAVAIVK